ncbi:MAG: hypothetical protein AB7K52_14855 [Phycisphaerales bacterium]
MARTGSRARGGGQAGGWLAGGTGGMISTVLVLVLAAGVLGGLVWGYGWLQGRVGDAGRVEPRVVISWPALRGEAAERGAGADAEDGGEPETWMSEAYRAPVVALVRSALSDDPYDRGALERAADALRSTGWVRQVRSITREPGGVVRVRATWRVPAAVVRHADSDYLVSTEGELLPPIFRAGSTGFRAIVNVSQGPPAQPGTSWPGGDVQAGLALLGQLQRHGLVYAQVVGIDVGQYATRRRLAAVTDRGSRVVWGIPPGESRVGEPSTASKMTQLDRLVRGAAFGYRIDANQPLVDLSNPAGVLIDASARPPEGGESDRGADSANDQAGSIAATARRRAGE